MQLLTSSKVRCFVDHGFSYNLPKMVLKVDASDGILAAEISQGPLGDGRDKVASCLP